MSLNKLISIQDVIYNAYEDTGIDVKSMTPTFMRWAVDAEKKIASYYSYVKQIEVIKGDKCRATLPINCQSIQMMVMGDKGCDCDTLLVDGGNWAVNNLSTEFVNTGMAAFFLQVDITPGGGNGFSLCNNPYEIQNNKLVFARSVDGQFITIQFLGYKLDCDGFLMVSENHIVACTNYIKLMIAERSKFSPLKMTDSDIKRLANNWEFERGRARGLDAELTPQDQWEITGMLTDPWSGQGLRVWDGFDGFNRLLSPYFTV